MLQRVGAGLLFAVLAMIVAGIVEIIRKNTHNLTNDYSVCDKDSKLPISDVTIFLQIPQFLLIGASEVLASITGLEFFFSQAPKSMRSVMMSVYLFTTALGSWSTALLIFIVNSDQSNQWIPNNLDNVCFIFKIYVTIYMCMCVYVCLCVNLCGNHAIILS